MKLVAALAVGVLSLGMLATAASATPAAPDNLGKATVHYAVNKPLCAKPATPDGIRCYALQRVKVAKGTPGARAYSVPDAIGLGPAGGYTPDDLAAAYSFNPKTSASSQTVGIVDWYDDPHALADLDKFDAQYGLPKETSTSFRKLNQTGTATPLPKADANSSGEIALDIESVRGVCNTCKILLVEAKTPSDANIAAAENEAVKLGATEVSNSFGEPEQSVSSTVFAAYNHPGVVITASTGDDGWFGWDDANPNDPGVSDGAPSFPSTDPDVVSVGGTELQLEATGARATETVWNENGLDDQLGIDNGQANGAGGGGCSTLYKAPAWQSHYAGYSAAGCKGKRLAADISAIADPETGLDIYDSYAGGWITVGGTSLASPVTAALFALAGGSGGASYPASTLYTNGVHYATALYDVVSGGNSFCGGDSTANCGNFVDSLFNPDDPDITHNPNGLGAGIVDCSYTRDDADPPAPPGLNSECNAVPGYDGPSGLGTPNGTRVFKHTNPSVSITKPTSIKLKKAASFAAKVTEPISGITPTTFAWTWGDGKTSSTASAKASHTFTKAGTYSVSVLVTDSSYQLVRKTVSITVGKAATVKVSGPSTLKLKKSGSYSSSGTTTPNTGAKISKVTWTWGDGKSSTGTKASHAYTKKGTYTISIVVLDSTGVSTKVTKKVKVS